MGGRTKEFKFNGVNNTNAKISLDSVEVTYTALIQQYLSLLCHENASFLAERMVAHRPTQQSVYLLAMSYYRSGSPKKARSVLLQYSDLWSYLDSTVNNANPLGKNKNHDTKIQSSRRVGKDGDERKESHGSGDVENNLQNDELERKRLKNAMTFLVAKCCMDLQLYTEAEDALLRECRIRFRCYLDKKRMKAKTHKTNISVELMDEWILNTSPCPIPNGAAGLNLLATVCRKSQRRKRAVDYYRMSLQLDPLMWISYEALCEMGAALCEENDPANLFGVIPPALLEIPCEGGGYAGINTESKTDDLQNDIDFNNSTSPRYPSTETPMTMEQDKISLNRRGNDRPSTSFNLDTSEMHIPSQSHHHLETPSTPFSTSRAYGSNGNVSEMLDIGENGEHNFHGNPATGSSQKAGSRHSQLPATSLFNTGGKYPPSTIAKQPKSAIMSAGKNYTANLPSTALFNTPGLTPIQRRESQISASKVPRPTNLHSDPATDINDSVMDSLAGSQSRHMTPNEDHIISRAKHIASRLYYEPSPETTPPHVYRNPIVPGSHLKLSRAKQSRSRVGRLCGLNSLGESSLNENDDIEAGKSMSQLNFSISESMSSPALGMKISDETNYSKRDDGFALKVEKRVLFRPSVEKIDYHKKKNGTGLTILNDKKTVYSKTPVKKLHNKFSPKVKTDIPYEIISSSKEGESSGIMSQLLGDKIEIEEDLGVKPILQLLCTLGAAHRLLCTYQSHEAIRIFQTLPFSQFNTGWVQHQVGKAYFEIADYKNAQRFLENMQKVEPHRMKGLEVLSTTLWHLKKEVELSYLAQKAVDFDRSSPEAWCVVGNCFSLQKEHETALTFFRRSLQLDSGFTYSHTLSGHEYVSNEDFEKAINCYRDALRGDDRHYNAWYGLGAIYIRQEKYDLAEYHFRRALSLNPQSSVLYCHLGMVQHSNGKPYEALNTLASAFRLHPKNPQARFQRANIWMSMDRPHEALEELERVRDAAPREASVHFAMGKVLKKLGKFEQAMRCFLTALDLDPKDNNLIKAAMDRLDEPDIDDEISTF